MCALLQWSVAAGDGDNILLRLHFVCRPHIPRESYAIVVFECVEDVHEGATVLLCALLK